MKILLPVKPGRSEQDERDQKSTMRPLTFFWNLMKQPAAFDLSGGGDLAELSGGVITMQQLGSASSSLRSNTAA